MLKIYNTLTGEKEEFRSIEPGRVRMYVCGITVYDYCHVGHARVFVVFDMVTRYLRNQGYQVTYIRNITDIDDKIINRANENGESIQELTERFIEYMNEDADALGILRPDAEPRATGHLNQIIDMIQKLLENGLAYQADNGDIFFDVSEFPEYGKLSGKKIDELRAGARIDIQEAKNDPVDFVLWKAAKPDEPSWESPWGEGRPGWHIECSAMSIHCLGEHFDIHGGGQDLQFPHHENEIAQSCGATGNDFVNLWMHNGFVRIDDEKMSKSLGNFFIVRDVLKKYQPEVIRFFMLSSHYRSPLNYSDEHLNEAKAALQGLYLTLRDHKAGKAPGDSNYHVNFNTAMDDDFNTPKALAVLHDLAHAINRGDSNGSETAERVAILRELGGVLGILQDDPVGFLRAGTPEDAAGLSEAEIDDYVAERTAAKKDKNYQRADEIRNLLSEQGVILEDTPGGTTWRRN